jgi:hypothetical protein
MTLNLKLPTVEEVGLARESSRQLAAAIGQGDFVRFRVNDDSTEICVPANALRLLVEGLAHLAAGDAVQMRSFPAELTVLQVAEVLNVSPARVRKIRDSGELAFGVVRGRKRMQLADVLDYLGKDRARRKAAADELIRLSQETNLGY